MFSTCIHCTADLGRNEAFELFPVGTRLSFDAAKGRLWVICRACDRWNLSPLEERWEAIESMERRFHDSRLRVSTDNVGLARLREGVDLIRIGEPQRPEMAAWRYGDQFGRRRTRQMLISGVVVGSATAIVGGIMAVGVSISSFAGIYGNPGLWDSLVHGRQGKSIGKFTLDSGRVVDVHRRHARMSRLVRSEPGGPMQLRLEFDKGSALITGDEVAKIAARLLPTVNRFGGSRAQVQEAVSLLEYVGDPAQVWSTLQQRHGWKDGDPTWGNGSFWMGENKKQNVKKLPGTLHSLKPRDRLALEMALHEESERRAMEGELATLEAAWREAEQIAKISDDMFLPADIDARIDDLKSR